MDIQKKTRERHKPFLILDDMLPAGALQSQTFVNLFTQYRHFNISVIVATQYVFKVPPTIRECCTMCVIFKTTTKRSNQALFETFGGNFNSLAEFVRYQLANTKDHHFILYNAMSDSMAISELYKSCKAPSKIPQFKYEY